jgi:hypothetical protein
MRDSLKKSPQKIKLSKVKILRKPLRTGAVKRPRQSTNDSSANNLISPKSYLSIDPQRIAPRAPGETPGFMGKKWLKNRVAEIIKYYNIKESAFGLFRVSPMGLIRCSRGGKSRALLEIGTMLKKKLPDTAVIFVSFNDQSSIKEHEQHDPLHALCVRIAYATYTE